MLKLRCQDTGILVLPICCPIPVGHSLKTNLAPVRSLVRCSLLLPVCLPHDLFYKKRLYKQPSTRQPII